MWARRHGKPQFLRRYGVAAPRVLFWVILSDSAQCTASGNRMRGQVSKSYAESGRYVYCAPGETASLYRSPGFKAVQSSLIHDRGGERTNSLRRGGHAASLLESRFLFPRRNEMLHQPLNPLTPTATVFPMALR
jgi:hypothetical protein